MKKMHVIFDTQGNIISAGHKESTVSMPKGAPAPDFGAVAGPGQTVAELDVPAPYEKLELHELIEKLQVDVKAKQPALLAKRP